VRLTPPGAVRFSITIFCYPASVKMLAGFALDHIDGSAGRGGHYEANFGLVGSLGRR